MEKEVFDMAGILKEQLDNPFINSLGLEVLEASVWHSKGRIPFKEDLLNPFGSMHGGVLYSLADIVSGIAAQMSGSICVTLSGSLSFLRPAIDTEYIYCEAKALRDGEHTLVYNVEISDDKGTLLDSGSFTFFKTGRAIS